MIGADDKSTLCHAIYLAQLDRTVGTDIVKCVDTSFTIARQQQRRTVILDNQMSVAIWQLCRQRNRHRPTSKKPRLFKRVPLLRDIYVRRHPSESAVNQFRVGIIKCRIVCALRVSKKVNPNLGQI